MKKLLFSLGFAVLLTGCIDPSKFDATDETTIKESVQKIINGLPDEQRKEFSEAVIYFTLGGLSGLVPMFGAALLSKDKVDGLTNVNLVAIAGLAGEQILIKYRTNLQQDRIKLKALALKNEAQELLRSNKFEEALAKYEAMNQVFFDVEAAEAGIAQTTKAMEDFSKRNGLS